MSQSQGQKLLEQYYFPQEACSTHTNLSGMHVQAIIFHCTACVCVFAQTGGLMRCVLLLLISVPDLRLYVSARHTVRDNVRREYEIREKRRPNKENKSDKSAGDGGRLKKEGF